MGFAQGCGDLVPTLQHRLQRHLWEQLCDYLVECKLKLTPPAAGSRFRVRSSPRGKSFVLLVPTFGSARPRTVCRTTKHGCFGHHVWGHVLTGRSTSSVLRSTRLAIAGDNIP